ncbi:AAA family ATPase [Microlunatus ginsengisoli]|uniref:AAA family ATPase n=1 Tax=Microlunatus ginsengisoli TaxID=363863 RepID=A0ABP6ZDT6_9ACTN
MIDIANLADLGLEPEAITKPAPVPEEPPIPLALTPGSPLARCLYEVWSGRPVTVVKAAPGSGKSTLIARLVCLLLSRTELSVTILAPTRDAAFDLAERVGEALSVNCGPQSRYVCLFGVSRPEEFPTHWSVPRLTQLVARHATVRTVASASGLHNPVTTEVVIVDEAYQTTLSDMAVALRDAKQVVLVGDPGQIGPVVTVDDSVWARQPTSPTRRAPEMLLERSDAILVELGTTYRLGPASTELLNTLYDFPVACGRSPRHVVHRPGVDPAGLRTADGGLPEIVRRQVPAVADRNDPGYLRAVADTARSYVGRTVHASTPAGDMIDFPLAASDICVVAAYRTQITRLAATLDSFKIGMFKVGTADALQGGQWHVVVAVDPLIAADTAEGHNASLGRLTVMLSRHMTHLVWVCDSRWSEVLDATPSTEATLPASRAVRARLAAAPELG